MFEVQRGGCLCGAVRYEAQGPLRPVVACHCDMCRRTSGHFAAATAVRREALVPGRLAPTAGAQALFYPSLRLHAPDGTVGDPRAADAARGERYLTAWTEALVALWERAMNSPHANGTQNA